MNSNQTNLQKHLVVPATPTWPLRTLISVAVQLRRRIKPNGGLWSESMSLEPEPENADVDVDQTGLWCWIRWMPERPSAQIMQRQYDMGLLMFRLIGIAMMDRKQRVADFFIDRVGVFTHDTQPYAATEYEI